MENKSPAGVDLMGLVLISRFTNMGISLIGSLGTGWKTWPIMVFGEFLWFRVKDY